MRRIKYGKEPILAVHRYIIRIGIRGKNRFHWGFRYLSNLDEVKTAREAAPKGSIVEVFSARHDFREAWEV